MNQHFTRATVFGEEVAGAVQRIQLLAAATLLAWLLYSAIFMLTMPLDPTDAAIAGATNVLPLALLAVSFGLAVRTYLLPLPPRLQAAGHALFAPAFAASWYGAIVVLQGLARMARGEGLDLIGFSGVVLSWQCLQGLVLYAAVASTSYALVRGGAGRPAEETKPLERYLAKAGDVIQRVDVGDIVSISGAQDYSEVATTYGRHLARFSLGEFERRLDPARFLRIHRSTIINLDRLERAEPAGNGRFVVVLTNGEAVQTSRTGAKKLRALVF